MKHIFRPDPNGTHARNSDNVRGILVSLPDTATIRPSSAEVSPEDFSEYVPPVSPPPPVIPYEIANWRARAVLEIAGILPAVEAALVAMGGSEGIVARSAWNAGASLLRDSATVTSLASQLNLSEEQVDNLFIQAASLQI